jgi:hypothetical protein
MKRVSIWSLIIVSALLLCLVLTLLFMSRFQGVSDRQPTSTPTPVPTFTPIVTVTIPVIVRVIPAPHPPTLTPVSEATSTSNPTPTATSTATPTSVIPQVVASVTVNIRSGPGPNYPVVGSLSPGISLRVTGQNEQGTWWQVQQVDGPIGWVAASVVEARDVDGIPIAQAPPPPEPTPTPVSEATPTPTRPKYQFEPTGWYDDTNYGLTRFLGNITDVNGNPVNGVTVEAKCGTYRVISNPSGPVPAFDSHDSAYDPPGFYDITVATRPVPCKWLLTVVYTEDGQTTLARLSETIEVEVTVDKSIIVANWRKNW